MQRYTRIKQVMKQILVEPDPHSEKLLPNNLTIFYCTGYGVFYFIVGAAVLLFQKYFGLRNIPWMN